MTVPTLFTYHICVMIFICPELKMALRGKRFNHMNKIQTKFLDTIIEFKAMHIMK